MTVNTQDSVKIVSPSGSYRNQRPDGILAHSETSQGNAADTTDDILFFFLVPGLTLLNAGDTLRIEAFGDTAANGNNKQIKVWLGVTAPTLGAAVSGGTLIGSSGTVTTNAGGWKATADIVRTGSKTQRAYGSVLSGVTTGAVSSEKTVTDTQDDTAGIYVAVTGASGTTGAAADVVGKLFRVSLINGG